MDEFIALLVENRSVMRVPRLMCHCVFAYRRSGDRRFTESGLYAKLAESDAIGDMQTNDLSKDNAFRRVFGKLLDVVRGTRAGVYGGQQCLRGVEGNTHWVLIA